MKSSSVKELFIESQMEEFFSLGSCLDERITKEIFEEGLTEEEFCCKLEFLIRKKVEELLFEAELEKALGNEHDLHTFHRLY